MLSGEATNTCINFIVWFDPIGDRTINNYLIYYYNSLCDNILINKAQRLNTNTFINY